MQPSSHQLILAASRTPGGPAPGLVRSVSAACRGPGSGHRKNQPPAAASLRPRGGRETHRPLRAAQTSSARGELWPAGTRLRGPCPPASGTRAAAGTPGLEEAASDGLPFSELLEEGRWTGVLGVGGSPLGAGPAFLIPPREGMEQRLFCGPGGKVSLSGDMLGSTRPRVVPALRWEQQY